MNARTSTKDRTPRKAAPRAPKRQGKRTTGATGSPTEGAVERTVAVGRRGLGAMLQGRPAIGATLAAGLGFLAAEALGVGELAMALAASYVAYRALRDEMSFMDALKETLKAKEGIGPAVQEHGQTASAT